MEMTVFSHEPCELGEGPLWSPERGSLFWVDINRHLVFEKSISSNTTRYDSCWEFTATPTALARVQNSTQHLWVITDTGLIRLELATGEQTREVAYQLPNGMRTNDANVGPDGRLWIGTMQRTPTSPSGSVFSIDVDGEVTPQAEHITIPNTFCWSPEGDHCYLTDSYERTLYRIPFPEEMKTFKRHPWQHSDCIDTTYDGGAVDRQGHLWIARWGGSRVDQLGPTGNILMRHLVPAQQPSSCCFGGTDGRLLFVTTATEGLSAKQRQTTPDAGKVFVMACQETGLDVPAFHMNSLL